MTHRFELLRLRLVGEDEIDTDFVQREFPTVKVERAPMCGSGDIVVDERVWHGAFDLRGLDERIEHAGPVASISVRGHDVGTIAGEVLTRYQRLLGRRNRASSAPLFNVVLNAHESLYDESVPLSKADLDHALDTWQWMLRLHPEAGLAPQLAALFHDIERLESEPRERMEHRVPDSQSIKDTNMRRSAERVVSLLVGAGVDADTAERTRNIVFCTERRAGDPEVLLLDDADALSFLSLNSARYIDYFGVAQTRRKVAYTLSRLGPRARQKLDRVRLRPDVERLLREVAA
ncbi:MAG: hypothetical protein K0S65_6780 [Labilithrix sp.]|nr:hypothetical protein [Labilithrix sp.]